MLTRLILLKSGIEDLALCLGEQEIALLHADCRYLARSFVVPSDVAMSY
jgi:hypothetical protein